MTTSTLTKATEPDWKVIHRVADRLTPALRTRFLAVLGRLRGRIDMGDLVRRIESGLDRLVALVGR